MYVYLILFDHVVYVYINLAVEDLGLLLLKSHISACTLNLYLRIVSLRFVSDRVL